MPTNTFSTFRPWAALAGLALILASLGGCVTPPPPRPVVVREVPPPPPRVVVRNMPPPIREDRGPAPGPGYSYLPGHWHWVGQDWAWVHGRWVPQVVEAMPPPIVEQITVAPSPAHFWVPGHWTWRFDGNGGWVWVAGQWRR